jgi:ADP-heptose:LPS heptosyltransferase
MQTTAMPGILSRLPTLPSKVVVLGETRLGAYICTTPVFRALRAALPDSEIVMVTEAALRGLVCRAPHLDRFVEVPSLELAQHALDARRLTRFFQTMQEEDFDLGIQMHGYGLQSSPFFVLLGARINVGFVGPRDMPGIMDAALPFPRQGHVIERYLELATFLGAPACGRETEFPLLEEDEAASESLLGSMPLPLIGIHPGARSSQRQWPSERFAAAAVGLQERAGGTIVILGNASDHSAAECIDRNVQGRCLNLVGRTSLPVLGAIIKRLSILLSNDSGPAHIAYALGTPAVVLFASQTKTPFWPPEDGPFRPLLCASPDGEGSGNNALNAIPVTHVLASAKEIMRLS